MEIEWWWVASKGVIHLALYDALTAQLKHSHSLPYPFLSLSLLNYAQPHVAVSGLSHLRNGFFIYIKKII
jgi:hypothetical protein